MAKQATAEAAPPLPTVSGPGGTWRYDLKPSAKGFSLSANLKSERIEGGATPVFSCRIECGRPVKVVSAKADGDGCLPHVEGNAVVVSRPCEESFELKAEYLPFPDPVVSSL